jgi:hypothetical protein
VMILVCSFVWCRLSYFEVVLLFVSVSLFLSLTLVCQNGVQGALNIWDLIALFFSEECVSTKDSLTEEIR